MKSIGANILEPDEWIRNVDFRFEHMKPTERRSLPLHEIVKKFAQYREGNQPNLNSEKMASIAGRIKILSQEKVVYYQSTRFGFIKQFFSCLRNAFRMGRFTSSGQLGLELSQRFLTEHPLTKSQETASNPGEEPLAVLTSQTDETARDDLLIENDEENTHCHVTGEEREAREESLDDLEKVKDKDSEFVDARDNAWFDELIAQGVPHYIFDLEQIEEQKNLEEGFEIEEDDDEKFYDAFETFDEQAIEVQKTNAVLNLSPFIENGEASFSLKKEKKVIRAATKDIPPKIVMAVKENPSLTPQEEMFNTMGTIWKQASEIENVWIQNIWAIIMKSAKVDKWKSTGQLNEYQLELTQEVIGTNPELQRGKLVIKQKMKVIFSEENIPSTEKYRQVITFPDKGICCRMGMGWLSKDIAVDRILVEEDRQHRIWCNVEAMGKRVRGAGVVILNFFAKTEWCL